MKAQYYNDLADKYLRCLNENQKVFYCYLCADTSAVEDPVGSDILKGKETLQKFYSSVITIGLKLKHVAQVRVADTEIPSHFQLIMNYTGTPKYH
ncbi:MAG: hypothetical protein ABI315_07750 [Bacteroidia bacterium]